MLSNSAVQGIPQRFCILFRLFGQPEHLLQFGDLIFLRLAHAIVCWMRGAQGRTTFAGRE